MIINASGGAGLNFKVVGGTAQPTTPQENTIWVNTSTKINKWTFSATAPSAPAEGDVWIRTGTSSTAEFEALKKNSISICPVAARQYVSGAWVDKTAKSYIDGGWMDWLLYIYKDGTLSQISGFTMTGGSMTNSSGVLTFTSTSTTTEYMLARSTQKIDFTGFKTLSVNFRSGSKVFRASSLTGTGYAGFGITTAAPSVNTSGYPRVTNYAAWRTFSHTGNNNAQPTGTLTLDVSAVNSAGYLCFLGDPYDGESSSWKAILKMDLIKLE